VGMRVEVLEGESHQDWCVLVDVDGGIGEV